MSRWMCAATLAVLALTLSSASPAEQPTAAASPGEVPSPEVVAAPEPAPIDPTLGGTISWDDTVVAQHPAGSVTLAQWWTRLQMSQPWKYASGEELRGIALGELGAVAYEQWRAGLGDAALSGPAALVARWYVVANTTSAARAGFSETPLPEGRAVTEEMVAARYEERRASYTIPSRVRFRYIFVPGADEGAIARAAEAAAKLAAGPDAFAAVAADYSQTSLDPKDRIVGPATRDAMLPEMAGSLFDELAEGETSGVLSIATGQVIVQLVSRTEERQVPLEQVRAGLQREIDQEVRQELHAAEMERLRAEHPFELLLPARPAFGERRDAVVFRLAGEEFTVEDLWSFVVFDARWVPDDTAWERAARDAHEVALARLAYEQLATEGDIEARYEEVTTQQLAWFRELAAALELLPMNDSQVEEMEQELMERFRQASDVEGRVIYVRPGDREAEQRSVVPRAEVLAEVEAIRARIEAGASFEEVARETSTDAASREQGGRVTTRDEGLDPAIVGALRSLRPGELSAPVALAKGYALVLPERVLNQLPASSEEIAWMAAPAFVRFRAGGYLRGFRSLYQRDMVKTEMAVVEPYLAALEQFAAAARPEVLEAKPTSGDAVAPQEGDPAHPLNVAPDRVGVPAP